MNLRFFQGLGVFGKKKQTSIFLYSKKNSQALEFKSIPQENEFEFHSPVHILSKDLKHALPSPEWRGFHIAKIPTGYFLTYHIANSKNPTLFGAFSHDLKEWHDAGPISNITEPGAVVSHAIHKERHVMYFGSKEIKVGFSADLHHWKIHPEPVLKPRSQFFDNGSLSVAHISYERDGILMLYYTKDRHDKYLMGTALFDKNEPADLLWRSSKPIWQEPEEWQDKKMAPLGIVESGGVLTAYWEESGKAIYAIRIKRVQFIRRIKGVPYTGPSLIRFHKNPVIVPAVERKWESKATFNPTAFVADDVVHIIYRAIGDDDVSRLGYAISRDGHNIDERLPDPIYVPTEPFEGAVPEQGHRHGEYNDSPYISGGGGWGGCEDPRITQVGDRLYMTYVAYDGFTAPRVALTSISLDDFLARNWNWDKPVLISEPNIVNKNACILPEKINGKYVIFHRIFPDILIDFVDDLNFDGKTKWLKTQAKIKPRPDCWDSRKLGIGGTPIKTDKGWLLIYQGMGGVDGTPSQYKIGAMLLDLNDPSKVLHRSKEPILEPEATYENHGFKAGVVYPCGAVIKNDQLFVYYGGADSYTCVASCPINKFIDDLTTNESPKVIPT